MIVMLRLVGREGYASQQEGHLRNVVGDEERGIPDGGDTVVMGGSGGETEAKDLEGTGDHRLMSITVELIIRFFYSGHTCIIIARLKEVSSIQG